MRYGIVRAPKAFKKASVIPADAFLNGALDAEPWKAWFWLFFLKPCERKTAKSRP